MDEENDYLEAFRTAAGAEVTPAPAPVSIYSCLGRFTTHNLVASPAYGDDLVCSRSGCGYRISRMELALRAGRRG